MIRARIGATGVAVMAMAAIHGAGFGIRAQTVALTGGLVLPISSEPVEGGTVLIVDGRIAAVGADVAIPAGAEVVDVTGSVVMPGIIDAMSYFGVAGEDMNEVPVPLTPELRIIEAFSPFGAFGSGAAGEIRVRELLQGGVTAMYIGPGDATVLGGQGVVVVSAGERFGDLIVREPAAIDITLGGRPASTYRDMSRSPATSAWRRWGGFSAARFRRACRPTRHATSGWRSSSPRSSASSSSLTGARGRIR